MWVFDIMFLHHLRLLLDLTSGFLKAKGNIPSMGRLKCQQQLDFSIRFSLTLGAEPTVGCR